jgi:hypothetical protein
MERVSRRLGSLVFAGLSLACPSLARATYSITALDRETGELGGSGASCVPYEVDSSVYPVSSKSQWGIVDVAGGFAPREERVPRRHAIGRQRGAHQYPRRLTGRSHRRAARLVRRVSSRGALPRDLAAERRR